MNTYYQIKHLNFLLQASDKELLWVQRIAILFVGAMATLISIQVPIVYGLFILAADVVFVIVFPQLICAVFFKWTNSYGAVMGYIVGVVLRVGAGEPMINLPSFIFYPDYDEDSGQNFPFRTFAMVTSMLCSVVISIVTNFICKKVVLKNYYSRAAADVSRINRQLLKLETVYELHQK